MKTLYRPENVAIDSGEEETIPMITKRIPLITTICLFVALTTAAVAAESSETPPFIGFRYDSSGFFPKDVTPPTDFDGVTGKNLLWKQPLPNFGNASPTVIPTADGGRCFVLIDHGYPLGEGDVPRLQCYHAQTGKLLWDKGIDPFDTLPEAEAAPLKAARHTYWKHQQAFNRCLVRAAQAKTVEELDAIRAEAAEHGPNLKHNKPVLQALGKPGTMKRKIGRHWTAALNRPDCAPLRRKRGSYDPWCDVRWHWTGVGMAACTPISDGEAVYVLTGLRTVTKFDLDGKVLWHVWEKDAKLTQYYECWLVNALQILPVEIDGTARRLLIQEYIDFLWAYDCDTGELVWKAPSKCGGHVCGTPQLLRLSGADGKEEVIIATRNGTYVRARDGKILLDNVYNVSYSGPISNGKDLVWFQQKGGDGGHFTPKKGSYFQEKCVGLLRFRLEGEELKYDKVLYTENLRGFGWPTELGFLRDGVLIGKNLTRTDAMTGRKLADGSLQTYHGSMLAGGHFYGIPRMTGLAGAPRRRRGDRTPVDLRVVCNVVQDGTFAPIGTRTIEILEVKPTDPAEYDKRAAMIGRTTPGEWYAWHSAYICPFAFEDKLYIRTFDTLFCFGHAVKGRPQDDPAVAKAITAGDAATAAKHLVSDVPLYRMAAVRRLAKLGAGTHATSLKKLAASDVYDEIRAGALAALGDVGAATLRELLLAACANNRQRILRDVAMQATLRSLSSEWANPALAPMHADKDVKVREAAAQAERYVPASEGQKTMLFARLEAEADTTVRKYLFHALGVHHGNDTAVREALITAALGTKPAADAAYRAVVGRIPYGAERLAFFKRVLALTGLSGRDPRLGAAAEAIAEMRPLPLDGVEAIIAGGGSNSLVSSLDGAQLDDKAVALLVAQLDDARNGLAAGLVLLRKDMAEDAVIAWYSKRVAGLDPKNRDHAEELSRLAGYTKFIGYDGADDAFKAKAATAILDVVVKVEGDTKARALSYLKRLGKAAAGERARIEQLAASSDAKVAAAAKAVLKGIE